MSNGIKVDEDFVTIGVKEEEKLDLKEAEIISGQTLYLKTIPSVVEEANADPHYQKGLHQYFDELVGVFLGQFAPTGTSFSPSSSS